MEEEETYADSETDEGSTIDYDSSSSSRADTPPLRHRTASLTVSGAPQHPFHGRQLVSYSAGNPPHYRALLARSSSTSSSSLNSSNGSNSPNSSPSSSAPSSPTVSPRVARAHLTNSSSTSLAKNVPTALCATSSGLGGSSGSLQGGNTPTNSRSQQSATPHSANTTHATTATIQQPAVVPGVEPAAQSNEIVEISKVDWSYLHLRPNPLPLGAGVSLPSKYLASFMFGPQYCAYPQLSPYNYMLGSAFFSNYHSLHFQNGMDSHNSTSCARSGSRHEDDASYSHGDSSNMDERQFDTNMFLSIPEEQHFQQYQSSAHNP
jgi:hypothetical protein